MNNPTIGLIIVGVLLAAGTLETQDQPDMFAHCVKERAMLLDTQETIRYCERKTGYNYGGK